MKKLFLLTLLLPLLAIGQEKGVRFEHGSTWEKVKAKARQENKHIFVDCFTTWCGPCIRMAENVFPQEKVGDFFNANFVNLKLQMDETNKDSEEVRSWRGEAKRFAEDYSVQAYPTFLIFSPEGKLVHRIVGGGEADEFIALAKKGLAPETQYVTLVERFEAEPNDVQIANKMAKAAAEAYDQEMEEKAVSRYIELAGEEDLLTKENIGLLVQILRRAKSSSSPAYQVLKNNPEKANELLASEPENRMNEDANDFLVEVLLRELVYPNVNPEENLPVNFDSLQTVIEKAHPEVRMDLAMAQLKVRYHAYKKNWPAFRDAVNAYIRVGIRAGKAVSDTKLNSFAWDIFENCDDPSCIQAALEWSGKSLEGRELSSFIDTYANLLYKSGDRENAIKWQEKAVEKARDHERGDYIATLDKMKKGEQTW